MIFRTIAAMVAAAGMSAAATLAISAPAKHYPRPDTVVISTRTKGSWVAHCHNVNTSVTGLWVFGGCLPPVNKS